jgi:hypothetical protein
MAIKERELLSHREVQKAHSAFYDGLDALPQLQASVQRLQPHLKSLRTIFAEVTTCATTTVLLFMLRRSVAGGLSAL